MLRFHPSWLPVLLLVAALVCPAQEAECERAQSAAHRDSGAGEQAIAQLARVRAALDSQQDRSAAYLAAARENRGKKADVADALYVSALRHAEQKVDILMEYLDWQQKRLNTQLGESDSLDTEQIAAAQELLGSLSALCEAALAEASVEDVARWADVTLKQSSLVAILERAHARLLNAQSARIDGDLAGLSGRGTDRELDEVLQSYAETPVLPELSDKLDDLMDEIRHWRSCRTQADEPLQLLEVTDAPRMLAWLRNFKARLESDAQSPDRRLEDFDASAALLIKAQGLATSCPELGRLVDEIEQVASRLACCGWQERAAASGDEKSMMQLLVESTSFSPAQLQILEKELLSLRNRLYALQLRDMKREKRYVDKEDVLSSRHQMLAALSLRCWELTAQSAPYINTENEAVRQDLCAQMSAELDKIMEIYRLDAEIQSYREGLAELKEYDDAITDARARFLKEAESRIETAARLHGWAYAKIDEWLTTQWNSDVQKMLRSAYRELLGINEIELRLVSPNDAYSNYANLKAEIEKYLSDQSGVEETLSIEKFMPEKFKSKK